LLKSYELFCLFFSNLLLLPYLHSNNRWGLFCAEEFNLLKKKYKCPQIPDPILNIYYIITKTDRNMQSYANCSITQKSLCLLCLTSTRENPVKPSVMFCSCTGQNFFRHISDFLYYPCTKGCRVNHSSSGSIILHLPPQEEKQLRDISEGWGFGYWSNMTNTSARKCLIKKCPHILTPVWERTVMVESS
jgi:hypothetical protein